MGAIMKITMILFFVFICVSLSATADIQVTYTGYTDEQILAFEHATYIWEPLLNSSVPIRINATLQTIPGFVEITIPNLIRNFPGAPVQDVWYSTALAHSIAGVDLNPEEADFDLVVNPSNNWYYGLDGNCPPGSFDFITEMMKGVAYGIGYLSSFYVQQGYGTYGALDPSVLGLTPSFAWEQMQGSPAIYDTFVCNAQGQSLVDSNLFPNPSPALNAQLTGGNLRYSGAHGMLYNGDQEPILYAGAFNLARTARLSADVYNGTENASGVTTAYYGSVLRYPAPIVLGMLEDQGWDININLLLASPTNLSADTLDGDVLLGWDAPLTDYIVQGYQVCRDGVMIGSTDTASYLDLDLPAGSYYYTIEAIYSMGTSEPSNGYSVEIPVGSIDPSLSPSPIELTLYPNPSSSAPSINLSLKAASPVRLALFDIKGRKLGERLLDLDQPGLHQLGSLTELMNTGKLPAGIYILKCTGSLEQASRRFLLLR